MEFRCPAPTCGTVYNAPVNIDQKVRCPRCGHIWRISETDFVIYEEDAAEPELPDDFSDGHAAARAEDLPHGHEREDRDERYSYADPARYGDGAAYEEAGEFEGPDAERSGLDDDHQFDASRRPGDAEHDHAGDAQIGDWQDEADQSDLKAQISASFSGEPREIIGQYDEDQDSAEDEDATWDDALSVQARAPESADDSEADWDEREQDVEAALRSAINAAADQGESDQSPDRLRSASQHVDEPDDAAEPDLEPGGTGLGPLEARLSSTGGNRDQARAGGTEADFEAADALQRIMRGLSEGPDEQGADDDDEQSIAAAIRGQTGAQERRAETARGLDDDGKIVRLKPAAAGIGLEARRPDRSPGPDRQDASDADKAAAQSDTEAHAVSRFFDRLARKSGEEKPAAVTAADQLDETASDIDETVDETTMSVEQDMHGLDEATDSEDARERDEDDEAALFEEYDFDEFDEQRERGEIESDEDDVPPIRPTSIATDEPSQRGTITIVAAWALFAAVLSGVGMTAVSFRDQIASALPAAGPLYAAAGLPVAGSRLGFEDVGYAWLGGEARSGMRFFGEIVNQADETQAIPPITIIFRDEAGKTLLTAVRKVERDDIAAGDRLPFSIELPIEDVRPSEIELKFSPASRASLD